MATGGPVWKVAVLGPGGIGGLVGALLARHGDTVTCIAPAATAAHLRARGLELRSARFGGFRVDVRAATALDEPVDVCFVTVKTTRLAEAVTAVPAATLGAGLLVPFQNGVDHVAWLRQRYPADQVVAGTIAVESARVAPGVIEHHSSFCRVDLAPGGAGRERVEALAERLRAVGMDVSLRDDERWMLWAKLVLLAPIALVGTHEGAPLGEVRERRGDDLTAVVHEIVETARAADGVELDATVPLQRVWNAPDSMRSSMLRDAEAGNPTELDAIGGAILRAAARAGVAAPVTTKLVDELRARERR
ncbi:MAG TPA: 2-dehydropantoate 2-reductase [Actinomycetes bacterium]|jgi:2-dehydropantoate 2-reductase|nr:2-dehydropantoate 2-reductase [Actinomycetes bacterium]